MTDKSNKRHMKNILHLVLVYEVLTTAVGYWKTVGYQLVQDCFDRTYFVISY